MRALLLLLVLVSALPAHGTAPQPIQVGVASALAKLRPGDPVPAAGVIDLAAARGECEAAQVAVRSGRAIAALSADARALRGPAALEVALYRVANVTLARGSGPDGLPGEWPDPLIPVRDGYFREARRAFPVEVGAGRLQAVWVEVCVPRDAPAGAYTGEVVLRDADRLLGRVPVRLRVWPFALPASNGFTAAFGLSTRLGTTALGVPADREVARALAAAALRHRVTPFVLSADPPDGRCSAARCDLDWRAIDAEVGPVLDGTLVPGVRGGFAEVRIPESVWRGPEPDLLATLRAWKAHYARRGWADRLWVYTLDEPGPGAWPELRRRGRIAHEAGLRVFATTLPSAALESAVDAFAPNLTLLPDRSARPAGVAFSYASCLSHGCAEMPEAGPLRAEFHQEFGGWPGYAIDRPGTSARAVPVLGWRRGLSGELYYDMLQTWRGDPWRDVRAFAGNGDGTLLYPGLPAKLGGEHPFPVESIRLKLVRDGLEDVELLRLASDAGLALLARRTAGALVPTGRGWERDPERWLAARRVLAEALAARTATRPASR